MKRNQKLDNSQWVAHNSETTDVLPHTLRPSLMQCQAAYLLTAFPVATAGYLTEANWEAKIVAELEGIIPLEIKFVTVTLRPRWETEL